jgi:CRP/FNR family transcriptional regulator
MIPAIAAIPIILRRSHLLSGPPKKLLDLVFAYGAAQHLKAGETLFYTGDAAEACYRVEQGLLKVVMASPRGKDRILSLLGPGAIVGEFGIIDGQPRSASVIAFKDCTLSSVSKTDFAKHLQQHPEIFPHLVNVLIARLRQTNEILAVDSFQTAEGRVALATLELAAHLGEADDSGRVLLKHKIKHADLAAMAGVARENVSRVISYWKKRKIVTQTSGCYCLHNIPALKRKAGL